MSADFNTYLNNRLMNSSSKEHITNGNESVTSTERLVRVEIEKLRENSEEIKKLKEILRDSGKDTPKTKNTPKK